MSCSRITRLLILLSLLSSPATADPASEWQGPILKQPGALHGIQVGAMGTIEPWNPVTQMVESLEFSDPTYVAVPELHFNLITSGQNYLASKLWNKPSDINDPSTYIYLPGGPEFVSTASNFDIHGAHMIWHLLLAPWMTAAQGFVAPNVETVMNHHIDKLAQLYPTIDRWVVVNEAIKNVPESTTSHVPGNLIDSIWKGEVGDDFVVKAFERATLAGIGTHIYNDYGIAYPTSPKTLAVLQLVTELDALNLIDGIGFQMHLAGVLAPPSVADLKANFEQFAALGLDVYVTEFDVAHCNTELCRTAVAPQIAFNVATACREVVACKSFAFWGLKNDLSWLHPSRVDPSVAGASSHYALPFDENYAPTPMFEAVVEAWAIPVPTLGPSAAGAPLFGLLLTGHWSVARRLPRLATPGRVHPIDSSEGDLSFVIPFIRC